MTTFRSTGYLVTLVFAVVTIVSVGASAKVHVVGTLPDFAALAGEIGGDRVEAVSLIRGTQDPHFVDARPSMVLSVNKADLLIFIGMGLEAGWLPTLINQSRNPRVLNGRPGYLDASTLITRLEVPTNPDRAMGDVHAEGNPHYYTSPVELHKVARGIYERLVAVDPDGKDYYAARWSRVDAEFVSRIAAWKAALAPLAGVSIVVYHKSWIYMFEWAGIREAAALEPVPGVPPSPAHVSRVLNTVRDRHVRFVIQEVYQPTSLSKVFAAKSGAKLLILPAMVGAEPGIRTVWDKFDRIVSLLTGND